MANTQCTKSAVSIWDAKRKNIRIHVKEEVVDFHRPGRDNLLSTEEKRALHGSLHSIQYIP